MQRAGRSDQVPPRSSAGRQRTREHSPGASRRAPPRSPHRPTPPVGKVAGREPEPGRPRRVPSDTRPARPGTCLWRRADSPAARAAAPAATAAAAPPAPRSAAASPPRRRPSTRDAAPCAAPAGCGARRRAGRREGACRRSLIRPRGQHRGGSGSRPGTAATSRGGETSIFMSGAGGPELGRRGTAPPPRPALRRAGRGRARALGGARAAARGRRGLAHLRALPQGWGWEAAGKPGCAWSCAGCPGCKGSAIREARGTPAGAPAPRAGRSLLSCCFVGAPARALCITALGSERGRRHSWYTAAHRGAACLCASRMAAGPGCSARGGSLTERRVPKSEDLSNIWPCHSCLGGITAIAQDWMGVGLSFNPFHFFLCMAQIPLCSMKYDFLLPPNNSTQVGWGTATRPKAPSPVQQAVFISWRRKEHAFSAPLHPDKYFPSYISWDKLLTPFLLAHLIRATEAAFLYSLLQGGTEQDKGKPGKRSNKIIWHTRQLLREHFLSALHFSPFYRGWFFFMRSLAFIRQRLLVKRQPLHPQSTNCKKKMFVPCC